MRRREHDKIVHLYQREIEHLRQANRELLDKLLYVTGNPWTPPPLPEIEAQEPMDDFSYAPEQTLDAFVEE